MLEIEHNKVESRVAHDLDKGWIGGLRETPQDHAATQGLAKGSHHVSQGRG
jgi:hypothetical protein